IRVEDLARSRRIQPGAYRIGIQSIHQVGQPHQLQRLAVGQLLELPPQRLDQQLLAKGKRLRRQLKSPVGNDTPATCQHLLESFPRLRLETVVAPLAGVANGRGKAEKPLLIEARQEGGDSFSLFKRQMDQDLLIIGQCNDEIYDGGQQWLTKVKPVQSEGLA